MEPHPIAFYTEGKDYYKDDENPELVIPQLLPTATPEMYSLWADIPDKLGHRIAYQFLHRDIIERFIVRTAHLSEQKEYWRNGLFINYLGSKAVVEVVPIEGEKDKKQIQIGCTGTAKQELLQKIREEFNQIRTLEKASEQRLENGQWINFSSKIHLEPGQSAGFDLPLPKHIATSNTIETSMKEHLLNLIAAGQLKDALDAMRQIEQTQSKYFKDPLIGLLARYNRNERSKNEGILDTREYNIEYNKIITAVKSLLDLDFNEALIPPTLKTQVIGDSMPKPVEDVKPVEDPKPVPTSKLKIVMLTANPAETTRLNLTKEHSKIVSKLQGQQSKFLLNKYDAVDRTGFKEITETEKPDVLHFSGHGAKGEEYGGIIVQNEDKSGYEMISPAKLTALFTYFKRKFTINTVVLNACFSQEQAEAIGKSVTYVIGTTKKIEDEHAISFSTGFYFSLADPNSSIEDAFESGKMEAIMAGASDTDFVLYKNGQLLPNQ